MAPHLAPAAVLRPRRDAIDLVRGLVMVIMALDHVRDFFSAGSNNPRDVNDAALFLTRWVTHFCAPTFVFLAGVSAYLYGHRGRSRATIARFLLTRGLWIVFLELSVVRFGWTFSLFPEVFFLQVIWAIGWSMVALSALVFLPRWAIGAFGLLLIFGHDAFDGVRAAQLGDLALLWNFAHDRAILGPYHGIHVIVSYPLIPWIGVMAAGYALGPIFTRPAAERTRSLALLGVAAVALFVVLRLTGVYGDPVARLTYPDALPTILSFLNCEKYPPSLDFLCMTLGPALLMLAAAERARGPVAGWLVTLGRVPMLYYVAHLFLVHLLAVGYSWIATGGVAWLFHGLPMRVKPPSYGLSLPLVYGVWIAVVAALTPACRWFAALKQRRKDWWLSYL